MMTKLSLADKSIVVRDFVNLAVMVSFLYHALNFLINVEVHLKEFISVLKLLILGHLVLNSGEVPRSFVDHLVVDIGQLLKVLFDMLLRDDQLLAVWIQLYKSIITPYLHLLVNSIVVLDHLDFMSLEEVLDVLNFVYVS